MGSVPNCRKEIANRYPIRWFKCKLVNLNHLKTYFKHEITYNKMENRKIIILLHNMLINVSIYSEIFCLKALVLSVLVCM